MQDSDRKSAIILSAIGIVPVVWLSLLIAPFVKGGLTEIVAGLMKSFEHPFQIQFCEDSLKTVLFLLAAYAVGIGIYFSTRRNYRRREEHGSAKWGNAKAVDRKYRQSPPSDNKLMTQNVRIGINAQKHILVISDVERVIGKVINQVKRNIPDLFEPCFVTFLLCGEKVIERRQSEVALSVCHLTTPPL